MLEKLNLIRELTDLFFGIDVHLMPNSEQELRLYLQEHISPKLGADLSNHPTIKQICQLDSAHIYEFTPLPGITTLIYSSDHINKLLFVGPTVSESFSDNNLLSYLQRQNISQKTISQILDSAGHLPVIPSHQLYHLMDILLRHLCDMHIPIPIKKMDPPNIFQLLPLLKDTTLPHDISMIRQIETRYETSSVLTEAVKLGNLSLALQPLHSQDNRYQMVRSQSPLRNAQNFCIILNTQLRHSLEGGDIHPYELDRLSSEIGVQIERLSAPDMALPFSTYIVEQYCHLVQEQSYKNLSPLIHQAVIYIKNNLSANLTVMDTAKELSVHPDYLSRQFRHEMGITFITFLNQERCKQAASYLKHTSLQIKQISAIVGFNTISYFTKQFAHFYGKTPRDFRNERIFRQ